MSLYRSALGQSAGPGVEPVRIDWFTTALRLYTDVPEVRGYVTEQHLVTGRDASAPLGPPARLYATADPALLSRVTDASRAGRTLRPRESFKGVWYSCSQAPDGEITMRVDRQHAYPHALLTRDFRSWAVVAEDPGHLGLLVTRTVRELVRENVLAQGAVMFHASAAQLPDGTGVFLAGASGAGKTSAAVRLARAGGRVVGTDRTFLLAREGHWLAVGLPVSTRLGPGAARALGIADALRDRATLRGGNPFRHTADPRGGTGEKQAEAAGGAGKVSLSNAETCELLGTGFAAAVEIDTVVLLNAVPDTPVRVDELSPGRGLSELSAHLLTPDPDYRSRWLAADPTPEPAGHVRARVEAFLEGRPAKSLTWDPAAHCDEHTAGLVMRARKAGTVTGADDTSRVSV